MSFLAGFAIKIQEGEYDAEPADEPKVDKIRKLMTMGCKDFMGEMF